MNLCVCLCVRVHHPPQRDPPKASTLHHDPPAFWRFLARDAVSKAIQSRAKTAQRGGEGVLGSLQPFRPLGKPKNECVYKKKTGGPFSVPLVALNAGFPFSLPFKPNQNTTCRQNRPSSGSACRKFLSSRSKSGKMPRESSSSPKAEKPKANKKKQKNKKRNTPPKKMVSTYLEFQLTSWWLGLVATRGVVPICTRTRASKPQKHQSKTPNGSQSNVHEHLCPKLGDQKNGWPPFGFPFGSTQKKVPSKIARMLLGSILSQAKSELHRPTLPTGQDEARAS